MTIEFKHITAIVLLSFSLTGFAQDYSANPDTSTPVMGTDATAKYLKTLGDYLGYDLESDVNLGDTMLDYTANVAAATTTGQNLIISLLRSIPINGLYAYFFTNTNYDAFNGAANQLFQSYATANNANGISATCKFDQAQWQSDPVTQAVLNMVGTPDPSSCPPSVGQATQSCSPPCLSSVDVMSTVLNDVTRNGRLPNENDYANYDSNTSLFISQLNGDNLIAPLVYSQPSTSEPPKTGGTPGLPAANQAQQAQAFIRYATEGVIPVPTLSKSDYSKLYSLAYPPRDTNGNIDPSIDLDNVNSAQIALRTYLLNLRVYAAKSSVAISNLYGILAKRMPQSVSNSSGGSSTTSQAVNEFQMATWRLYNPVTQQSNDQWAQKINAASSSTIQKEMAVLLSEINYQLYLNRQQQERILLTDSMILMQLLSANKPSGEFPTSVDKDPSVDSSTPAGQ
ncbi:MAG: hypothetical protein Q8R83_08705 [Legionellaceae bacterium]|nr:hypothetical protein [Legionellaceae bacterium]